MRRPQLPSDHHLTNHFQGQVEVMHFGQLFMGERWPKIGVAFPNPSESFFLDLGVQLFDQFLSVSLVRRDFQLHAWAAARSPSFLLNDSPGVPWHFDTGLRTAQPDSRSNAVFVINEAKY
jgi:hypothetical protein